MNKEGVFICLIGVGVASFLRGIIVGDGKTNKRACYLGIGIRLLLNSMRKFRTFGICFELHKFTILQFLKGSVVVYFRM